MDPEALLALRRENIKKATAALFEKRKKEKEKKEMEEKQKMEKTIETKKSNDQNEQIQKQEENTTPISKTELNLEKPKEIIQIQPNTVSENVEEKPIPKIRCLSDLFIFPTLENQKKMASIQMTPVMPSKLNTTKKRKREPSSESSSSESESSEEDSRVSKNIIDKKQTNNTNLKKTDDKTDERQSTSNIPNIMQMAGGLFKNIPDNVKSAASTTGYHLSCALLLACFTVAQRLLRTYAQEAISTNNQGNYLHSTPTSAPIVSTVVENVPKITPMVTMSSSRNEDFSKFIR